MEGYIRLTVILLSRLKCWTNGANMLLHVKWVMKILWVGQPFAVRLFPDEIHTHTPPSPTTTTTLESLGRFLFLTPTTIKKRYNQATFNIFPAVWKRQVNVRKQELCEWLLHNHTARKKIAAHENYRKFCSFFTLLLTGNLHCIILSCFQGIKRW